MCVRTSVPVEADRCRGRASTLPPLLSRASFPASMSFVFSLFFYSQILKLLPISFCVRPVALSFVVTEGLHLTPRN